MKSDSYENHDGLSDWIISMYQQSQELFKVLLFI